MVEQQEVIQHENISVAEFLSVCIFLSEECGKLIRQVEESGELAQRQKGVNDPVTIADLRVQKTLEVNLKHLYPTLKIQGEESKESIADVESLVGLDFITEEVKKFISSEDLNKKHEERREWIDSVLRQTYDETEVSSDLFETFNTQNSVVWIDPLDGTNDFVKGNLPAVTVLIGLSVNDRSRVGIVHNPYSVEDSQKGMTIYGSAEHGAYRVAHSREMSKEELLAREKSYMEPFGVGAAEDHKIRVAASLSHFSEKMQQIIEKVEPVEICRIGGAGNKCCNLAQGNVDAYIHPSPGLKFWDLCPNEPLVKAMGGFATDLYSNRLRYPLESDHKIKGLFLAKNPAFMDLIKRRMGEFLTTLVTTIKL